LLDRKFTLYVGRGWGEMEPMLVTYSDFMNLYFCHVVPVFTWWLACFH